MRRGKIYDATELSGKVDQLNTHRTSSVILVTKIPKNFGVRSDQLFQWSTVVGYINLERLMLVVSQLILTA